MCRTAFLVMSRSANEIGSRPWLPRLRCAGHATHPHLDQKEPASVSDPSMSIVRNQLRCPHRRGMSSCPLALRSWPGALDVSSKAPGWILLVLLRAAFLFRDFRSGRDLRASEAARRVARESSPARIPNSGQQPDLLSLFSSPTPQRRRFGL